MSRILLLVVACALLLTVLFWLPLWQGGGLIGGDLYPYFFPQKTVYADQLHEGTLPLWNRLVGFGYPLLAESQTGVFYPLNPFLYRLLSVNAAYNVSQLMHYGLAFVFTWLLMRRLDLSAWGAALGATVFVYGWFPPRICLEWAIIGGVYLPLCLWCVESFLQTGGRLWLCGLAAALGVHLLAGHFNLAFITQLTVLIYAAGRVLWARDSPGPVFSQGSRWRRAFVPIALSVACGFALAAVQLLPTWELKQLSQREDVGAFHDPGYGHIPPWYLSQIVAPWMWYSAESDPDQALNAIKALSIPSATNKVEAHLYFGIVPLLLACWRIVLAIRGIAPLDRRHLILFLLGLMATIYATGWLLPVTRHLPGFNFFMGPGRYGIVATLAAALLAGSGLGLVLPGRAKRPVVKTPAKRPDSAQQPGVRRADAGFTTHLQRAVFASVVIGLTLADLFWVSRRVTYAVMVADPPINHRHESDVASVLREFQGEGPTLRPVRVWAPGANVVSLTGFSATPVYLGLGPSAYFDPELTMPQPASDASFGEQQATLAAQKDWLKRAAVTHILRMEPLTPHEWPEATLVWSGFDRFLNFVWGRSPREPLFLYELADTDAFARFGDSSPAGTAAVRSLKENSVEIIVSTPTDSRLTVAQLAYPGWKAKVDERSAPVQAESQFLGVDVPAGEHVVELAYRPKVVIWGAAVSAVAWLGLVGYAVRTAVRKRRD